MGVRASTSMAAMRSRACAAADAAVNLSPEALDENVLRAAEALLGADALLVCTGAGMGVDAGVPDFRGTEALFSQFKHSMSYTQMSNAEHFTTDPAFAWGVNCTQLDIYRNASPHDGFEILLKWVAALGKPWFCFTSNIDGMLQKAGFPDRQVVACHGDLRYLQCSNGRCSGASRPAGAPPAVWRHSLPTGLRVDTTTLRLADPSLLEDRKMRCPRCGSLARPNVHFCFDRSFVMSDFARSKQAALDHFLSAVRDGKRRVVVLECGAGLAIPTVRTKSEEVVASGGVGSCLIRINPNDPQAPFTHPSRCVQLKLGAAEALARIDEALMRHCPELFDRPEHADGEAAMSC